MKRIAPIVIALFFFAEMVWAAPRGQYSHLQVDNVLKGDGLNYVDVKAHMSVVTYLAWLVAPSLVNIQPETQMAVDNAIQKGIVDVVMPRGWCRIDSPIHLGYGGGSSHPYTTINLTGTGPAYGASIVPGAWSGTTIDARNIADAPAIVVQGGRLSSVQNLAIIGPSRGSGSAPIAAYETAIHTNTVSYDNISTPANWVFNIPAAGQSRYAPSAGIAIDPYSGTRPATSYPDVTYPAWTGIATQYGKNPSTRTRIRNVAIFGFYVGIAQQPSDYDGNGDYTTVEDSMIDGCAFGISMGNSNSRNMELHNLQFGALNGNHTALAGNVHGKQTGYFGGPVKNVSFRRGFQIFSFAMPALTGVVSFENVYTEGGMVRLGDLGTSGSVNNPLTIRGGRLVTLGFANVLVPGADGFNACIYNVPLLEGAGSVIVDGVTIYSNCGFATLTQRLDMPIDIRSSNIYSASYYTTDNNWKLAHNFFVGGVGVVSDRAEFSGTSWVPLFTSGMPAYSPAFITYKAQDTVSGREPIHRFAKWYKNQYGPTVPIQNRNLYRDFTWTGMTPTFDNTTFVMTFIYPGATYQAINDYRIEPGCVLLHDGSKALFIVDNVTASGPDWIVSATMATNYYYTGATSRAPVAPVALTGLLSLYQTFHKGSTFQWRGNVTAGSDNVTSMTCNATGASACGNASDSFKVGDLVWNSIYNFDNHLPAATKVLSAGSNWVQLDTVATDNGTGVAIELYR